MSRSSLLFLAFGAALSLARAQSTVPAVTQSIPAQSLAPGGAFAALDLRQYFGVPGVSSQNQLVQFDTVLGKFNVELRADAAPQNVANFLHYVTSGAYARTFFHRSASFDNVSNAIVQGGGYRQPIPPTQITHDASPAPLEYNLPNARGTLAAARTTDPNSATSEWYFNVQDNSTALAPNANSAGYTVFGRVLGTGMTVIDSIATLPRVDARDSASSPFGELPLRNYDVSARPLPAITDANLVTVNSITTIPTYPSANEAALVGFSVQNSNPGVATATVSGFTLTLVPVAAGTTNVTVTAADVNGNSVTSTFAVTVVAAAPTFTSQPLSQTVASGSTVVFNAAAPGATNYQWSRNGTALAGATSATLVLTGANVAAGTYSVVATNAIGSTPSGNATLAVVNTTDVGRLINLSILTSLDSGEKMTMGTVLGGAATGGPKALLARAAGPSLAAAPFNMNGVLPDPTMALISTSVTPNVTVDTNNDWQGTSTLADAFARVGAFPYASPSSKDAAIYRPSLSPGNYTIEVTDAGTGSGTVIAELYDETPAAAFTATTPRLINVSVLKTIKTGQTLTTGFYVGGSTSRTVLIRAVGPRLALAPFSIPTAMANPQLTLFNASQAAIATNDDWGGDPQLTAVANGVGAFAVTDPASKDSMLLVTLPPGLYTAQATAATGTTGGTAIVEVYEVP